MDLHINIPFCTEEPLFCDYIHVSQIRPWQYDAYLGCLEKEIRILELPTGMRIQRLFFTGGSATLLSPSQIERLFSLLHRCFRIESPEVTIEVDHCPAPPETLRAFSENGVRRLIFGVQSLQPELAKSLKWKQDRKNITKTMSDIRRAGIPLIRINLMAGLPAQTQASFVSDLKFILNLNPGAVILMPFTPAAYPPLFCSAPPLRFHYSNALTPREIVRRASLFALGRSMIGQARLPACSDQDWIGGFSSQLCLGFGSLSRIRGHLLYRSGPNYREYRNRLQEGNPPPTVGCPMNGDREMRSYVIREIECPGLVRKNEFRRLFRNDFKNVFGRELSHLGGVSDLRDSPQFWDLSRRSSLERALFAKFFYEPAITRLFREAYRKRPVREERVNKQLLQLYCLSPLVKNDSGAAYS
ncbi:MAG: hypothetical protein A3G41_05785 [Elusimicrobia bacterium RIFCSPLOWO2_12_FULL_59_9]|nr:MAG: hypothetical protein A3G41_05785 [Elusimicrobia bacterium RIFCSPLOWO2_12_FULL_59_9]